MKKAVKLCTLFLAFTLCISVVISAADTIEFDDVQEEDYFYPAVNWGVREGITYGVDEHIFKPEGEVTRAQIVTFLWRMADQPASNAGLKFIDVEEDCWYGPAVKWAVETGITVGTSEETFEPDTVCDRAMCITLLYRFMGSPIDNVDLTSFEEIGEEISLEDMSLEEFGALLIKEFVQSMREMNTLPDVPEGAYYERSVIWCLLNGIIKADNTEVLEESVLFHPSDPCVRKEMISFLYQAKKLQDFANAPNMYEFGEITVPIPQKYSALLALEVYGFSEDEGDFEEETLIVVSEFASKEAAEAMGEEDTDGIGELFRLICVSEEKLHEMLCSDMSGQIVLAKGEKNRYYILCYPTDVRYVRETTEQMNEDIDTWSNLTGWAANDLPKDIMQYSERLSGVFYTNTMLDMYLARIAYAKDIVYTISTTDFGPLTGTKVDGTNYAEALLSGNFAWAEDAEAPDGEYIVLTFPEEGVRYDFFKADEMLVREIRGEYETFYRRVLTGENTNTEIMQTWYDAIAKQADKK